LDSAHFAEHFDLVLSKGVELGKLFVVENNQSERKQSPEFGKLFSVLSQDHLQVLEVKELDGGKRLLVGVHVAHLLFLFGVREQVLEASNLALGELELRDHDFVQSPILFDSHASGDVNNFVKGIAHRNNCFARLEQLLFVSNI
jgi:hypothetical protein